MLGIIVVGTGAGILTLAWLTHAGRDLRSRLLRHAGLALFVTTLLIEVPWVSEHPLVDLTRRLTLLVMEVCLVLLVLTFRAVPVSHRTVRTVMTAAGLAAGLQISLWTQLTPQPDGTAIRARELETHWDAAYFGLYQLNLMITVMVLAVGCCRVLFRRGQPFLARLAVGLCLLGALCATTFTTSSMLVILDRPMFPLTSVDEIHHRLFGASILFGFAGLVVGYLRRTTAN